MDRFLFWDCLAVIGAIVVHRWAVIAVARYADGDPSRAPSVASLAARWPGGDLSGGDEPVRNHVALIFLGKQSYGSLNGHSIHPAGGPCGP